MRYGANPFPGGGVQFRVWAPEVQGLSLCLADRPAMAMHRDGEDFKLLVPEARPGDNYSFLFSDGRTHPDPMSRSQPHGVHGPSEIIDPDAFAWADQDWCGIPLRDYILYELHIGTFTPQGTFGAAIGKLDHLKDLGITAVELMPVGEFPGARNWGYDQVDLFAPHSAYGGAKGLKRLVDACHRAGLAVVMDVIYNHVGPEGNYLSQFGPYFTDHYRTPWGRAINYDGALSDGVRQFVIDNALYWLTEYHVDALRLDAIHGIFDSSARHILAELRSRFHEEAARLGRQAWIIAESDLNDVRVLDAASKGGYALDAQWLDEFHHAVRAYTTRANRSYLAGFGELRHIQKAITDGFVYDGCYSPFRRRHFGTSSRDLPGGRFVAFLQNHDQIANTSQGARLSHLISSEQNKIALALLLCSPCLPLLFMGEEFAETNPFLYFTSHGDPALARAVSDGRWREFEEFTEASAFVDPQSTDAFERSKLTWELMHQPQHRAIFDLYRRLIRLRKEWPCLHNGRKDLTRVDVDESAAWLRMERGDPAGTRAVLFCNFSNAKIAPDVHAPLALSTSVVADRQTIAPCSASLYLSDR
ncbi:MAG TPA: malto-oligosyltrehalose trehalohydrolase [Bryobacteraceae bacterium]|nr:malto-oligosyltrehalose trehalohydrolase [Bryobacteraceae bacterium]